MSKDWKILSKKGIFSDDWKSVEEWQVQTHNGDSLSFSMVIEKDVVIVFGITPDDKILLLRQHYISAQKKVPTLVAGIVMNNDHKLVAGNELHEEAGCRAKEMVHLGSSFRGKYVTGSVHYYLAKDIESCLSQELEPAEDIEIEFISLEKFKGLLRNCEIEDQAQLACSYLALDYLGKL